MTSRSARPVGVLAALLIAVGACGIPLDEEPQVIASEDLPRVLQPGAAEVTTTTSLPTRDSVDVTIYLIDPVAGNATLVPVLRQVPGESSQRQQERAALQHLLDGPTSEEQLENDLTTLVVPSGDEPIALLDIRHPAPDQVEVVLSEAPAIEGADRVTSFAQIVFTLTQFPGNSMVSFLVPDDDGGEVVIPVQTDTEEGDVTRPVGRSDYSTVLVAQEDEEGSQS